MVFTVYSRLWIIPIFVLLINTELALTDIDESLHFTEEPPYQLEFSNTTGTKIKCSAIGKPPITLSWIMADMSEVKNVSGLRQVMSDGTVIFPPFRAEDYRQDVHAVVYRCLASNEFGSIISREAHVFAVMDQPFEPQVYDAFATLGGVAMLKCAVPEMLAKYVKVLAWIKDNEQKIDTSFFDDKKFVIASTTGDLLVSDVRIQDADSTYKCQVQHRLTGEIKISSTAGKIFVNEPQGNIPSKIVPISTLFSASIGERIALPCIGQGFPIPLVKWYKVNEERALIPVTANSGIKLTKFALLIDKVVESDAGNYSCSAENSLETNKLQLTLNIIDKLQVKITTMSVKIESDKIQELKCIVSDSRATISWYKNGHSLPMASILPQLNISETGIYQCFATNNQDMMQDSIVVISKDSVPKIVLGFDEQIVYPGDTVILQCKAEGNPLPKIKWYLEDTLLTTSEKIFLQDKTEDINIAHSVITLSNINVKDGGIYMCDAYNTAGNSKFMARVNVYGELNVRKMTAKTVVSGKDFITSCPYYGYPVDSIQWLKDSVILPTMFHQSVFENGTLLVSNVKKGLDNGRYTCSVSNIHGKSSFGSFNMTVMISPKIMPFSFQEELLREGMRARLQCVVSEGDSPITIQWLKDNTNIPSDLGINVQHLDEYSSILNIGSVNPKHNGNYTCKATNAAATTMHTARLNVNGNGFCNNRC